MRKFEVKIQKIQENSITISARDKKEALEKAFELVNTTAIKDLKIKNVTKNYVLIDLGNETLLNKKNRRCINE